MRKRKRMSCPTPSKVPHKTLRAAKEQAKTFARRHVTYETVQPMFGYLCRCGAWHLTHKASGVHETVPILDIPTSLQEWARTKVTPE